MDGPEKVIVPETPKLPYDAILVPGGGSQRDADPSSLPEWTIRRLDAAKDVWVTQHQVPIIITLSAGTPHRPNFVDADGFPVLEATSAALYLQQQGVPPSALLQETTSLDTIGNAYFARVQHTDPAGFRRLLIITSAFHMPRTAAIFDWLFSLNPDPERPYVLSYLSVSDANIDDEVIVARAQREQDSLRGFLRTSASLRSLRDVHSWLFREHKAYAVPVLGVRRAAAVAGAVKASY